MELERAAAETFPGSSLYVQGDWDRYRALARERLGRLQPGERLSAMSNALAHAINGAIERQDALAEARARGTWDYLEEAAETWRKSG